jgi:hypothetical protein
VGYRREDHPRAAEGVTARRDGQGRGAELGTGEEGAMMDWKQVIPMVGGSLSFSIGLVYFFAAPFCGEHQRLVFISGALCWIAAAIFFG